MDKSDSEDHSQHEEDKDYAEQEEQTVIPSKSRKSRTRGNKKKKNKEDDGEGKEKRQGGDQIFSLFMSGLPYECDEQQIRTFFNNSCSIVKVNLPKYQDSGRCLGYAHVEFNNKSEYEKGLAKNKEPIGGRYIDISPSRGLFVFYSEITIPPDCRTIFVGNLPYDISEDQVGDKFRKYGEIDQIRFTHVRGVFKGYAYVDFKYSESVPKALELCGKEFKGRNLVVDFSTAPPKKGYKIRLHEEGNKMYNKGIKKEIASKKKRKEKMRAKMENWKDF